MLNHVELIGFYMQRWSPCFAQIGDVAVLRIFDILNGWFIQNIFI